MRFSEFIDSNMINYLRKFHLNRLAGTGDRLTSRSCKISDFRGIVENAGFSCLGGFVVEVLGSCAGFVILKGGVL